MNYESNGQLLDGQVTDVDTVARFPLGKRVEADNGLVFRYVKATAALTAGTAYGLSALSITTATAPEDNTISITATTPAIANVAAEDVVGAPVIVNGEMKFITSAVKNAAGTTITATVPGIKKSATIAGVPAGYSRLGGKAGNGVAQAVPMATLKSGEYGWAYEIADAIVASGS